jgi:general secretion pathway protein G
MRRNNRQRAFTLLEIMLVISIIVVLLGLAISQMGDPMGFTKSVAVRADIQAIGSQLKLYESLAGSPPTTEQGLQALVTQPTTDPRPMRWQGPYFKEIPKDPWGNNYIYLNPGRRNPNSYDLYSAGKDRQADTADDDWGK